MALVTPKGVLTRQLTQWLSGQTYAGNVNYNFGGGDAAAQAELRNEDNRGRFLYVVSARMSSAPAARMDLSIGPSLATATPTATQCLVAGNANGPGNIYLKAFASAPTIAAIHAVESAATLQFGQTDPYAAILPPGYSCFLTVTGANLKTCFSFGYLLDLPWRVNP